MILKELYLYPDLVEYPKEITSAVRDQTRCLCNFLERNSLKKIKFKTESFKRICIVGHDVPDKKVFINSCNVAVKEAIFDKYLYDFRKKSEQDLHEFFISWLMSGLECLNEQLAIPLENIEEGVQLFRDGDYKNEWIYKSKKIAGTNYKATLKCCLTMNEFKLYLVIDSKSEVIAEELVITTIPDEIVFVRKFNDLVVHNGIVQVLDKFGDLVFEYNVANIQ